MECAHCYPEARCLRQTWKHDGMAFGEGKKEAPAIDEGEEARLCGGLWTNSLLVILLVPGVQVNRFNRILLEKSAHGNQHFPGPHFGSELEGATLPRRVHYRQGRTGGATSDYVVFRAKPSEGGTSEANSARTAGRPHGGMVLKPWQPHAPRRAAAKGTAVNIVAVRTYDAASIRRRGLPAGGMHRGRRYQLTGRYVHTSISQTATRQPGFFLRRSQVQSSKPTRYTTKSDKVGRCDAIFSFFAISQVSCDLLSDAECPAGGCP